METAAYKLDGHNQIGTIDWNRVYGYRNESSENEEPLSQHVPFFNSSQVQLTAPITLSGFEIIERAAERSSCNRRSQQVAIEILLNPGDSQEKRNYFLRQCRGETLRHVIGGCKKQRLGQLADSLSHDGRRVLLEMKPKQYSQCAKMVSDCFQQWKVHLTKVWPCPYSGYRNKISEAFAKEFIRVDPTLYYSHHLLHPDFFNFERRKLLSIDRDLFVTIFSKDDPVLKELLTYYRLADFQFLPAQIGSDTLICFLRHLSVQHITEAVNAIRSALPHIDSHLGAVPRNQIKAKIKELLTQLLAERPLYLIVFLQEQARLESSCVKDLLIKCFGESKKILSSLVALAETEADRLLFNCYSVLPFEVQKHLFLHCDEQGHERLLDAMPQLPAQQMLSQLNVMEAKRIFPAIMQWAPSNLQNFFFTYLSNTCKLAIADEIHQQRICIRFIRDLSREDIDICSEYAIDTQRLNAATPVQMALRMRNPSIARQILPLFRLLDEQKKHLFFIFCSDELNVKRITSYALDKELFSLNQWEIQHIMRSTEWVLPRKYPKHELTLEYYKSCLEEMLYLQPHPRNQITPGLKLLSFIQICCTAKKSIDYLENNFYLMREKLLSGLFILRFYQKKLEENSTQETDSPIHKNFQSLLRNFHLFQRSVISSHLTQDFYIDVLSSTISLMSQDRRFHKIVSSLEKFRERYQLLHNRSFLLKKHLQEVPRSSFDLSFSYYLPHKKIPSAADDIEPFIDSLLRYHTYHSEQTFYGLLQQISSKVQDLSAPASNHVAAAILQRSIVRESDVGNTSEKQSTMQSGNDALKAIYHEAVNTLELLETSERLEDFSAHYSYEDMIEADLYQIEHLQNRGIHTTYELAKEILRFHLEQRGITNTLLEEHSVTVEELLLHGIWGPDELREKNVKAASDLAKLLKKNEE